MQMPFRNNFYNNQHSYCPSGPTWRRNFTPRGPYQPRGMRPPWRQPPPVFSNEFWCETCDRGFATATILENHKNQHQTCNIDGCQFIAHPKVITKHIQMQHASGLYKKIAKLQDPEEVKKWREERKKKYPTKENIEKAAAAIKEKIDRGEKMGLKRNKNNQLGKTEKRRQFDNQNPTAPYNNRNMVPSKRRRPNAKVLKIQVYEESRKLQPFAGIQELEMEEEVEEETLECAFTIEDDEEFLLTNSTTPIVQVGSASVCQALSSLVCNYGSSDDEEDIKNKSIVGKRDFPKKYLQKKDNTANIDTNKMESLKEVSHNAEESKANGSGDDSSPEEVKICKHAIDKNKNIDGTVSASQNRKKLKDKLPKKIIHKRQRQKLPSTLLHKLLFKEMRQERNIVLQCIRHIVKNNYFDKNK